MAAKERGVKFGRQAPEPETAEMKLRLARQLISEGQSVTGASEAVGWSRATLYRYLKQHGTDEAPRPEGSAATRPAHGRSR